MKTIRLFYPDYVSGGLDTYYFGAHLLQHILPANDRQPCVRVAVAPPSTQEKSVCDGIFAQDEVLASLHDAQAKLELENPDKIITLGGNCFVSLAPFDYLHGRYDKLGIIWLDAHPDVTTLKDDYPYAHAMVLAALLGRGAPQLCKAMKNKAFHPEHVLYVGLQGLHDAQARFLDEAGVPYHVQNQAFVSHEEICAFVQRFEQIVIHCDLDVLDEHFFHSTYFANPELVGDGSGGGKMKLEQLAEILQLIHTNAEVVGFTIAEYLPFDEYKLHKILAKLPMFTA